MPLALMLRDKHDEDGGVRKSSAYDALRELP